MKPNPTPAAAAKDPRVNIGTVIKQSGVTRQTIHYYIRIGLLPRPLRTSRTYALYPRETVILLKLIGECQLQLRLSLDEIATLLRNAHHDVRRVRSEMEELKKTISSGVRTAEARPEFITLDQLLVDLQPPPPPGWLEELKSSGLIRMAGNRLAEHSAGLIHSIWRLQQLGIRQQDLRPLARKIDGETEALVNAFLHAVRAQSTDRRDYPTASRIFEELNQFTHWTRKERAGATFQQLTHRPTDLFVGPNQKHVLPSETLLSEMGLNREIDRLLNGLDRSPHHRKALTDLAHAYFLRTDWFNLAGVSNKILQLDPENVRATADLSRSLIYLGDIDQSIHLLERRLKLGPAPLLKFRLGQALLLQAREAGVQDLLAAVRRKQQLAAEALHESRNSPGIRRWIRLDSALDDLTVSDPLQLHQPTMEELDALNREYQQLSERGRSVLSRISLVTGKIFASYALYLICQRDRDPRADELLRSLIAMDPHTALSHRPARLAK